LIVPKLYSPERAVAGEDPRIGVFVCHCGTNIAGVVNVPDVLEYAKTLPNVVYAENCIPAPTIPRIASRRKSPNTISTESSWPPARREPTSLFSATPWPRLD
jgi:hypothetical protein